MAVGSCRMTMLSTLRSPTLPRIFVQCPAGIFSGWKFSELCLSVCKMWLSIYVLIASCYGNHHNVSYIIYILHMMIYIYIFRYTCIEIEPGFTIYLRPERPYDLIPQCQPFQVQPWKGTHPSLVKPSCIILSHKKKLDVKTWWKHMTTSD